VRYTEAPARRAELLRRLEQEGYLASSSLAAELGVSEMTIRRDLRQLESEGLARRVIGGASLPGWTTAGLPFEARGASGAREKQAIAEAAVALLGDATTLALDAGTTVAALAPLLRPGVSVVTHSLPVLAALEARGDIDLVGIGGHYQGETRSFAGPLAEAALDALTADVAVLSATAVDERGLLGSSILDAPLKRRLAAIARRVVLLADAAKLGGHAPIRLGGLDLVDVLVTDDRADEAALAPFRAAGLEIVVAPAAAERAG